MEGISTGNNSLQSNDKFSYLWDMIGAGDGTEASAIVSWEWMKEA